MKNIYIISFIALNTTIAFAIQPADIKQFYCPSSITCSKDNDFSSCKLQTENPNDWGKMYSNHDSYRFPADTYELNNVVAPFHSHEILPTTCSYSSQKAPSFFIDLFSIEERNLEVSYQEPTHWTFSKDSSYARCEAKEAKSCPLKYQPALNIYNLNVIGGVTMSIDGSVIGNAGASQYSKVIYDSALAHCKHDTCKINFSTSEGIYFGYVTLNMQDNMKIINVTSETPNYAEISQMKDSNIVKIRFTQLGLR